MVQSGCRAWTAKTTDIHRPFLARMLGQRADAQRRAAPIKASRFLRMILSFGQRIWGRAPRGEIYGEDLADHQPVEQHADRGQPLLGGGR